MTHVFGFPRHIVGGGWQWDIHPTGVMRNIVQKMFKETCHGNPNMQFIKLGLNNSTLFTGLMTMAEDIGLYVNILEVVLLFTHFNTGPAKTSWNI